MLTYRTFSSYAELKMEIMVETLCTKNVKISIENPHTQNSRIGQEPLKALACFGLGGT
jgi:hypothetical protein